MAQKIFDVQQIVNGDVPIGGRIYIGAYADDPVESPGLVYLDSDGLTSIITPVRIGFDGRPVDASGEPLTLYATESYSMQIRDKYDANVFEMPWRVEVLDVDPDGNAAINILQPVSVDDDSSVGTTANPYDAGYFRLISLTLTPESTDLSHAANVEYVNAGLDEKSNIQSASATGTEISFTADTIYNIATPATGNITQNLTGAKRGVEVTIYHNDASPPSFPAEWVLVGNGTYTISVLNIIIARYVSATRIEYVITQEA